MMGSGFGGMMGSGFGGWVVLESTRRRDEHPVGVSGVYHAQGPAPVTASTPSSGARALLDERYARGDIGREEYLQRRTDLG